MVTEFLTIKLEVQSLGTEALAKIYLQGSESPIIHLDHSNVEKLLENGLEMGDRLFNFLFYPTKNFDSDTVDGKWGLYQWLQTAVSPSQTAVSPSQTAVSPSQKDGKRLRVQLQINEALLPPRKWQLADIGLLKSLKEEDREQSVDLISILPWELILEGFWKNLAANLSLENYLQQNSPSLVRILRPSYSTPQLIKVQDQQGSPMLRFLFAWANPQVNPQDRQFAETQGATDIPEIVEKLEALSPLMIVEVCENATIDQIQQKIEAQRFDFIHILTHGDLDKDERFDEARLVLERDDDHTPCAITGPALTKLLCQQAERRPPQIVFLHACQSATTTRHYQSGIAQSLIQGGVDYVVAMQSSIGLPEAGDFAKAFYEEIARGQPIDLALLKSRSKLIGKSSEKQIGHPLLTNFRGFKPLPVWAVPVLFMSHQAANGNGYLEQGPMPKAIRWTDGKVMLLIETAEESFYVDKYPVTAGQYAASLQCNGQSIWKNEWAEHPDPEKIPASNMTVTEAQQYAEKYGKQLPTLKRWRQAAWGGSEGDVFPWGSIFALQRARFGYHSPVSVTIHEPQNTVGICDIVGNIAEMADGGEKWYQCGGCYKSSTKEKLRIRDVIEIYQPKNLSVGFRCIVEISDYRKALQKGVGCDSQKPKQSASTDIDEFPKLTNTR